MESKKPTGHTVRTWSGQAYEMPIDRAQFRSLPNYVEEMLAMQGCDNTLAHAQTWARAHGVAWSRLGPTLRSLGGFCDCEIAMNIAQEYDDPDDGWDEED